VRVLHIVRLNARRVVIFRLRWSVYKYSLQVQPGCDTCLGILLTSGAKSTDSLGLLIRQLAPLRAPEPDPDDLCIGVMRGPYQSLDLTSSG
jgi:hypothetical protein